MKIEVTEEMRGMIEARASFDIEVRGEKTTATRRVYAASEFRRVSQVLARLVAEAVERAEAQREVET